LTKAARETLDRLREAFVRAEFTDDRLGGAGLGPRTAATDELWPFRAIATEEPLNLFVRLWALGAAVEEREARPALAPAGLDELHAAGLLRRAGPARVAATVAIRPYGNVLVAADRPRATVDEAPDFVPGVNPVARVLARHTIRLPVGSALDLGTGNGMQALAASRHAEHVLGTDVNPRALAYAELNAALNGVDNLSLASGSWFEPVPDERFDLILANLPFVVSPDTGFTYRDSGLGPGEVGEMVVAQAPQHLAEGGYAHVLCEWGVRPGEDWADLPRSWVTRSGCDALILRGEVLDPVVHAAAWNHRLLGLDPNAFEEAVERWSRHHRDHGFETIVGATIVLRRRNGGGVPWVSALELPTRSTAEAGDHVLRIFQGEDLVRATQEREDAILALRLSVPERLRVEQVVTTREGRWRHRKAKLKFSPGLGLVAEVDPDFLPVLFAFDGRPVEDVVRDVAARRRDDHERLRAQAVEEVPQLVRKGLLAQGSSPKPGVP
jgi:methylase of polypeptide subunit release factors